ncbi:Arylsulfatase [Symmachiella macrocystis]|uniref:Arylsulfatase n=1 Tax=Symmachiella macrocystis TaxID=2527985 RepID=A0A5C6AYI2_9PLAN|nr:arylsulfatase [Symmachiella macrocystis]TWU04219.1 Arylsulfatase [Symmachiella macrocystis]
MYLSLVRFLSFGLFACWLGTLSAQEADIDRAHLPIDVKAVGGKVGQTADVSAPPRLVTPRAPENAPNVVLVLLDDVGFGAAGTFGGPIETPAMDALATEGLRYNRFHTTALCSPSRAALLTGRNHHSVGTGMVAEFATAFPSYNSVIPKSAATIAQVLQGNGYSTACYGKWHNTPVWEVSPAGPFDRWPTSLGFDEFYGFMAGEANQFFPALFHGTTPIERPEHVEDYHLTTDIVDQSLQWMMRQKVTNPDKPFFVYFAPGATHSPHHAPKEYIQKYQGKFNQGWDKLREETFARQKKLRVIPADTKLTARDASIPAWDSLSDDEQKVASRLMEVYAGFLDHTDYEVGRLAGGIKELGEWDNTMFIYIVGDNGAAGPGGRYGVFNAMVNLNGLREDKGVVLKKLYECGGPTANSDYATGHAWAMCTPFQFVKQFASHFGGTRNPVIITWPDRIKDKGGLRNQFHHLIDIAPTIYESAGIPAPSSVNGIDQMPVHGVDMTYTFEDSDAPSTRSRQYFEVVGVRGVYDDGWVACTYHNKYSWQASEVPDFADDRWELYHVEEDFSQAEDLAAKYPEKLAELKKLFLEQADKYDVFPLDDRGFARVLESGRPTIVGDRTSFTLRSGAVRMPEDMIRTTFNKSYEISAELDIPKKGKVQGVLLAAGGYFGGLSLYVKDGRPQFTYNYFGSKHTTISADEALPSGKVNVRYEFDYDGGGIGKGGSAKLFVNDKLVAQGKIPQTVPLGFSADETLDAGEDTGTPSGEYECPFRFSGNLRKVTVTID